jgi:hypothetical protein
MLEISQNLPEQRKGFAELLLFVLGEPRHGFGKGLHAAFARFPHQADAFGSGFEADAATVLCGVPAYQAGALEAGDDAAHGRGPDLFRVGEFAKRFGAAEYEDG